MDPISRIAKDTGVPREVLVKVVAKTVTEHRVVINDDDPADAPADHGELVSMSEAARLSGVPRGTLAGWIDEGVIRHYGEDGKRRGAPRRVDIDEVRAAAARLPRRRGPRGPRTPAYLKPEYSGVQ